MITAKLKGVKVHDRRVMAAVKNASVAPLDKCALLVEREAKKSMKAGGALGRVGPRGGYVREPSAPGTPPHVQRGALRASIGWARDGESRVVGPTEKYGAAHEFGTRLLPKRPFMRPALQKVKSKFAALFRNLRLK